MKPKFETKKNILKLILPLALFLLLVPAANAQYDSFEQCMEENSLDICCKDAQFSTRTECLASDANKSNPRQDTTPIQDLSGRASGNTGSSNAAGCQKSDDQCPAPNFCYINGVCVPVPKSSTGIVGASSVFELVTIVLRWLFTFAGIVATVYLIIGGYQYMTSAGNEEAAEQGRKTIVNAVIGIIAVVFAITVITIITNTLSGDNPIGYVQKETKV